MNKTLRTPAVNMHAKRHASAQQNPMVVLLSGLVLLGLSYGAASWAIDSGRWLAYGVAIATLYFGGRSVIRAAKHYIRN